MPREATIFYSWQSDLPNKTNRGLIEAALRRAIEELHKSGILDEEHVIDRDTKGTPGSPDIAATIFKKIDSSSIFVADVSIIAISPSGRPCPNPNVLVELGYAVKSLGLDNLILAYNTAFGAISDLPFDLRGKRVASYSLAPDEEPATVRLELTRLFVDALSEIAQHQRHGAAFQRNSEFGTSLVSILTRAQLFGNEVQRRRINPWLDEISSVFGDVSQWLREHSHKSAAADLGLAESMEAVALALEAVRDHVHTLGDGRAFSTKVLAATEAAADLQAKVVGKGALTEEASTEIIALIADLHKRLAAWVVRTSGQDLYHSGRYRDFISAVTDIGYQLAHLSYFPVDRIEGGTAESLRRIGEVLHLLDLKDEMSGHRGRSREPIVDMVAENEKELRSIVQRLGLTE